MREFSFGHARQLESVLRAHVCALTARTPLLAGLERVPWILRVGCGKTPGCCTAMT